MTVRPLRTVARARTAASALGVAVGLLCGTARARAEPALWVVNSRTATVYLFGTIHLLKPDARWETPRIRAAFERSDELWLEVPDASEAAAEPAVSRFGFDRRTPLSDKLSAYDRGRLAADARALGEPLSDFEPMRPWLAAVRLSIAPAIRAGYDPQAGVDRALRRQAELDGRPVRAFETVEQQIRALADVPEPMQLAQLHAALDEFARRREELSALERAWRAGDTRSIHRALEADRRRTGRALYRSLVLARTRALASGVLRRLRGRGTVFVAVGAGHLVGPDGIPALLARRGLKVRRL